MPPPAAIVAEAASAAAWDGQAAAAVLSAAERGDASAQHAMGLRRASDALDEPEDFAESARWYRLAAEQGFAHAQGKLAEALFMGNGVSQSDSEAIKWWRLGAVQGLPAAQAALAAAYVLGDCGLEANVDEAARLFALAAAAGDAAAAVELERLRRSPASAAASPSERAHVDALSAKALKAELTARGVSVAGLTERRDLVEALLGAPPALAASPAAAPEPATPSAAAEPVAAAPTATPAPPARDSAVAARRSAPAPRPPAVYEPCASIRAENAASAAWLAAPLADNLAAAERGDAAAQSAMGMRYDMGTHGVAQDNPRGVFWFRKAAEQGVAYAQTMLGNASTSGDGGARSDAEAVKWYLLAAAQGQPAAQFTLGLAYEQGRGGLVADVDAAHRLYKLAAQAGDPQATEVLRTLGFSPEGTLLCRVCHMLPPLGAELQRCGGCKEAHYCGKECQLADWAPRHRDECKEVRARLADQVTAMAAQQAAMRRWAARPLAELRRAAERRDPQAQAMLGECYYRGEKGLEKSWLHAEDWLARASAGDNASAQTALGLLYQAGDGVRQDPVEAVRLYRLAATQGYADGMYSLAVCLDEGAGTDPDVAQAVQWMRRAAELGQPRAQAELARWYMHGESGLPVSYKEALRYSKLAAAQGNAAAMYCLGLCHAKGLGGVAKDEDEACRLWRKAAELGDEAAKDSLRVMARDFARPAAVEAVRALNLGPFVLGGAALATALGSLAAP